LVDELLEIASWPVALPTTVGLNVNVRLSVWPGFRVVGRLVDDTENPVPVTAIVLTVTDAVPLEVRVTVWVVELSITTAPKEILVAFTLRIGVAAFSWSEIDFELLPVVAVRVAVCEVLTAVTAAVNVALDAAAGTVTDAGTVTELLPLARATLIPPVGADPDSVTVQLSDSEPVIDVEPQFRPLIVGARAVPVPLRLTDAVGAVLEIVSCPETELAVVGLNWTDNTTACPGFKVTGKFPPDTENPVPEIESEFSVTATLPFEVTVTDFVTAVPTETFPNASELVLRLIAGTAAFKVSP
jgi:hypothetical protein